MIWSKEQQQFLDLAATNENIFLSGKAGTGKSQVIKELIKRSPNGTAVLAPTGIAASNIGGQTLHSFYQIPFEGIFGDIRYVKSTKRQLWDKVNRLIIDEASMLRCDMLDVIAEILDKNGCKPLSSKQIILVGDMEQLPVVMTQQDIELFSDIYERHDFKGALNYDSLNIKEIELETIFRQTDMEFINELNNIRNGIPTKYFSQFRGKTPRGLILCPTKRLAEYHNVNEIDKLSGSYYTFDAKIEGDVNTDNFVTPSQLKLKDGTQVMYTINNSNGLYNGAIGNISIKNNYSLFFIEKHTKISYPLTKNEFIQNKYTIDPKTKNVKLEKVGSMWQYPIVPAYALTIHKSQGLTLDEVTIDTSEKMFLRQQLYTALTRVKSPAGLTII